FLYFYEEQVDFLILEVGMGGAIDSTNVVQNPLVSVITNVTFDHMDYLGDTIAEIASVKAG
ncbi:MAG TPA: bifunctional folylpolyglutamate synthase/dihydrofolate synthase, partial [Peptococcaceae bacterium]|nr:bifunctional folylpolyglutamate synthase/dihydrofolate synthase [Peptococcaceae bacterium]